MENNRSEILDEKRFGKYFILAFFIVFLGIFLLVIKPFFLLIVVAAVMATLFYPLFELVLKLTGKTRRGIASMLTCLMILLSFLLPLLLISNVVVMQGIDLYRTAGPELTGIIDKAKTGFLGRFSDSVAVKWLASYNIQFDLHNIISSSIHYIGSFTGQFLNKASKTAAAVLFDIFVTLFCLFYFLRDGKDILLKIKAFIPISEDYKERIITTFSSMTSAIVKGVLFIGLLQTFFATLTLLFFGIETWLLWGVIMLFLSVIPFVGTGPVLIPAGIIMIINGNVGQGIIIILISIGFISLIDNFLRPLIVGRQSGMHDLLVFLSMIGGIFMFGPLGIVVGPLTAAVFLTVLEIYSIEFKKHIEMSIGSGE